jgi:hypothetical protein
MWTKENCVIKKIPPISNTNIAASQISEAES